MSDRRPPRRIVYPGPALLRALALLALFGLLPAFLPVLRPVWGGLALLLALIAGFDLLRLLRLPEPRGRRRLPVGFSLGNEHRVRLELVPADERALRLDLHDHHPDECEILGLPARRVQLAPGRETHIEYRLRPRRRGRMRFPGCELHLHSPLGLWRQRRWLPLTAHIRVYPDLAPVARYTLLAAEHRLSLMGIRLRRQRGEGQDFHQLREWREGDALRQIDWKASARLQRLVSREYQQERDQQIVFLLDCGHRMRSRDGLRSHFDHALDAILLTAQVALRQGDAVGFASFSGEPRWLPPFKGAPLMKRLLDTVFDLEPTRRAPDYAEAATRLLLRQRRRALVILVTNLRDEDPTELLPAVRMLRERHLVLIASLRETLLDELRDRPLETFEDALRLAAAEDYRQRRREALEALTAHRVMTVDTAPAELAPALVNRYLEIKAEGQL